MTGGNKERSKKRFFQGDGDSKSAGGPKRQRRTGNEVQLTPGMIGFFVSATKGRERMASKEVSGLITEQLESLYADALAAASAPAAASTEADTESKPAAAAASSIEDDIARELSNLAESKGDNFHSSHLQHLGMATDCLLFLQLTPAALATAVDPVRVIENMFEELVGGDGERKAPRTRFAHRIIPFQATCKADEDEIAKTVADLVEKNPPSESKEGKASFALNVKIRNNPRVDRDRLIAKLAKPLVDAGHAVNLTQPEMSVVIEVIRGVAGVCIVHGGRYVRLRRFNLHEVYAKGIDEGVAAATNEEAAVAEGVEKAGESAPTK
ncbi:hypothetical protein AMAG_00507 [Allomyces macrogynus ATCC 38327]|uniref:THUMP domain-containing protein n=1 Tax=Allomyces macrogynus (strain ATCC 38327) TaxID=578462 RepID=A0A0L0RVW5_ALLM3|nr:hypothetical protein AMAG_00507 [Allomyces macrogynus ATCC 38327]|eukprot:KNE54537.1 hypothetical protein AMAG_00507 [Allomyces macrogynus ATCC 38327]